MGFKSFSESKMQKSKQNKWENVLEVVKIVDSEEYEKENARKKRKLKLKNFKNKIKSSISFKPELKDFLWKLKMFPIIYFLWCIIAFGIVVQIFWNPFNDYDLRSNNISSILLFIFIWWLVVPLIFFLLFKYGNDSVKNFLGTICLLLAIPFFWCIFCLWFVRPFLIDDFLWSFFLWFYVPYLIIYLFICGYIFGNRDDY